MKFPVNSPCPCGSKKKYKKCCKIYHDGSLSLTALALMKSRYSAFKVGNSDYIIKTTHPNNSDYTKDIISWKNSIEEFSQYSDFKALEILEFIDGEKEAFVTFKATIFQDNQDISFIEKSRFLKENSAWLYVDGEFI